MNCVYCGSAKLIKRGRTVGGDWMMRCKECKRSFTPFVTFPSELHLLIPAAKNTLQLPAKLVSKMGLTENDKLAVGIDKNELHLFRQSYGFALIRDTNSVRLVMRGAAVRQIRNNFNLDYYKTYKIIGHIENDIFKMKIITKLNSKRLKSGRQDGVPFLTIQRDLVIRINTAAIDLLMLEEHDRLILAEDKDKMFVGISDKEDAFHVSFAKFGSTLVTSRAFANEIMELYEIERSKKAMRIYLNPTAVEYDGYTLFELIRPEK